MPKINTRAKGHTLERKLVKIFKDLGYEKCSTSRYESKKLDDEKVDLCNTAPFYVQAKAVEKLGCLHTILDTMPKRKKFMNIVWHKKNRKGEIVAMRAEDFISLVKLLIETGGITPEC